MKSLFLTEVLFISLLAGYPAFGGNSTSDSSVKSDSPLSVRAVSPGQGDFTSCALATIDGGALGLDMRYLGQKVLRGYLVAVYYRKPSGYLTERKLVAPSESLIAPGAKWHSTVCGLPSDANVNNVSVNVDLLVFGDESISGPVELRDSNHFYGVIEGMAFISGKSRVKQFITPLPITSGMTGDRVPDGGTSLPVKFTATTRRSHSGEGSIVIEATNTGTVPLIGFVFKLSFFDHATGVFVRSVTTKALATSGNTTDYLLPDASWRLGSRKLPMSSDGALDSYSITLDTVVLADGTALGPKASRESDELLGMIEGESMAKSMLASSR